MTSEDLKTGLRDAAGVTAGCAVVALLVNGVLHPEGIPLVADAPYEILVPCPEPGGEVKALEPGHPWLEADERRTYLVDARGADAYETWHAARAVNVTYDYLDPTPVEVTDELAKNIARSRAQRVAVYGDGDDPDSGEQLGMEIAEHGIRKVFFVRGGAPALRKVLGGRE